MKKDVERHRAQQDTSQKDADKKWSQQVKERETLLAFTFQQLAHLRNQFSSDAGSHPTTPTTSAPTTPKGGVQTSPSTSSAAFSFAESQDRIKEELKLLSRAMVTRLEGIQSKNVNMHEVLAKYQEENSSLRRELADVIRIVKEKEKKRQRMKETESKKELQQQQLQQLLQQQQLQLLQQQQQQLQQHTTFTENGDSQRHNNRNKHNSNNNKGGVDGEDDGGESMDEMLRQAQARIARLSDNNRVLILELEEKRQLIDRINQVYRDVKQYANNLLTQPPQQQQQSHRNSYNNIHHPSPLHKQLLVDKENREN